MKQEISKNNKNLIIKLSIPLEARRYNPYDESEGDKMDNVVGVIAGDEIGFAYWIDRDYKGKGDDISAPFYLYQEDLDSFRNLCKEFKVDIVEYPDCAYCHKTIFGSFGFGEKGNKCFDCGMAT